MFKWFWTIFSSGAPEKFLGNICSFKQLFYSKKSLGAPERESELRSCEERERKTTCFSLSLPLHGSLSLFREENFKKNLWDYSLKFIRLLPVVFPSQQQRSNRMKFRLLGLGYVTYRTAMNDPSVNSRVGFPYGRVLYEPRHERVMAVFWEYLRLKYFGPNDTLRQWYISKDLGGEPYLE